MKGLIPLLLLWVADGPIPIRATVAQEVGEVFRDCAVCPEMVVVTPGSFMMGSPDTEEERDDDEGPQHEVTIDYAFAVGVYEVTFEEWDACVRGGGCGGYEPDDWSWGRGRRPVMEVNWEDAWLYADWLTEQTGEGYRLLTEAEWEYVARADTRTPRYWEGAEREQCRHANGYDANGRAEHGFDRDFVGCRDRQPNTAPVGSYRPNGFRLSISLGTCGNGWTTAGTRATRALQRTAVRGTKETVPAAWRVADRGYTPQDCSAQPTAARTQQTSGTSPWAFAWPGASHDCLGLRRCHIWLS